MLTIIPQSLVDIAPDNRWVVWKWEARNGKRTKPPVMVKMGRPVGYAHNDKPETWTSLQAAQEAAPYADGIGLQLLGLKGFAAIDLDDVRDETGELLPWAADLVTRAASYSEYTPSGKGARIIGKVPGDYPTEHTRIDHPGGGHFELYVNLTEGRGRYITVSGNKIDGTPDALVDISGIVSELMRLRAPQQVNSSQKPRNARFEIDTGTADLPGWVRVYLNGTGTGDRSADFQAIVNALRPRGWSFEAALTLFENHPDGPGAKFMDRLETELRRSWEKADAPRQDARLGPPHNASIQKAVIRASRFFPAAEWKAKPVQPREWLVPDLVPSGTVTLLGGDGGTGKSLLALQLAYAVATGTEWIRRPVAGGGALFLSAEDDEAELHRRLADVVQANGGSFDELDRLHLRSLAGEDALLAILGGPGLLHKSALFREIEAHIAETRPALVVLDTLADLFPGNENDRAQARQFIGLLRGLAIKYCCAILLLAHPSLSGLNSGSGTSGSTGWNNSVRSRLYLERVSEQGYEANPDARVLRTMKANYGRTGGEINVTWVAGVFVADAPTTGLDRMAGNAKAERVFLKLLDEFAREGRFVKSANAAGYAPKAFASSGRAEGLSKQALQGAMERLFVKGQIVEILGGDGPKSKHTKRIQRTS